MTTSGILTKAAFMGDPTAAFIDTQLLKKYS